MKPTSTGVNKLPAVLCILAALFFGAMAVLCLRFPVEAYSQRILQAETSLAQAEEALAKKEAETSKTLEEAKSKQEALSTQLAQLQALRQEKTSQRDEIRAQMTDLQQLPQEIIQLRHTYGEKVRQLEDLILADQVDIKICYLTFDDGPNNLTAQILQRLEELDAYATFFTIGANDARRQEENLRAEMMGGHTVANHTFSHAIEWGLYKDLEEFSKQVMLQDEKVYNATGFHMNLFRFPSGSMKCTFLPEAEAWLEENGYKWVDWNSSAWDSGFHTFDVGGGAISTNVYYNTKDLDIAVVLCHDFNYSTYDGMKLFIPRLRNEGFIFLPLFPESHMLDEPLPVV